jgi:putative DNA methylase
LNHKDNPSLEVKFRSVSLLDPFAGFGSIPLEAKRLGVSKVIASELLPTAYFFLNTVLKYPKYGDKLMEDVEKYGNLLIKRIKEISEKWYDATGYVGSWEVKCPHCGNYTPLVNQWWLLKLGGENEAEGEGEEEVKSGTFSRLVFMEPTIENNTLRIRVRDINKELKLGSKVEAKISKNVIRKDSREFKVPEGNVRAKNNYARCLYCNNVFPGKGDNWYVKEAIRDWSEKYEKFIDGEISLEELENAKARPKLLVKFYDVRKDLAFEELNQQEEEKFWNAFEELQKINITLIPTESIAEYASRRTPVSWGMDKFFKLFNARQLLILSYIVESIKGLEIQGDDEYKDAVLSYLTLALLNYVLHNSLVTSVDPSREFIRYSLRFRGLAFTWNWVEISPTRDIIGSLKRSLSHISEGLDYLVYETNSNSGVEVINSDVLDLDVGKVDVIVTDPPYADDVPYPEVSDFYYVWVKRIFPFPYEVQWKDLAYKDIGVDIGRKNYFGNNVGTYDYFRNRLALAFQKMFEILKDDGLLVTFYNHTSPDAWASLLYAGWYKSKFKITATYAITTEYKARVTARNTTKSLDKSLVIVWRKKAEGRKPVQLVKNEVLENVSNWVSDYLKKDFTFTFDTFIEVMGKVLEGFTKYEELLGLKDPGDEIVHDQDTGINIVKKLVNNYIFPLTAQSIVKGLSKGAGVTIDAVSSYYLLVKILLPTRKMGRRIDKNDQTILSISSAIESKKLEEDSIINEDGTLITLIEPLGDDATELMNSLEKMPYVKKALQGDLNFTNAVQVLHYLEYKSLKEPENLRNITDELRDKTRFVNEALGLAKMFVRVLSKDDPEKMLAERIVGRDKEGLDKFTG